MLTLTPYKNKKRKHRLKKKVDNKLKEYHNKFIKETKPLLQKLNNFIKYFIHYETAKHDKIKAM